MIETSRGKKLEAQRTEPVSLTFHSVLKKLYTEEKIFLEITRNKNCLWRPCSL